MPFPRPRRGQLVDEDGLRKVGLLAVQDCLDGRAGDVAETPCCSRSGVDAEAAGCEPEVSVVVKDHGQKILRQLLAERSLGCRLDVNVQYLSNSGRTFPASSVAAASSTWLLLVGQTMRFSESRNV